ncbi:hypothetical protein LWI28_019838 [Acer negundo]|uniref:Uncharacterized protein n=1 Tax=Acer negundo TaxID=4023 RepID=A0AAD5JAT2_ACENE|nr:hypothetical protein LWI28_019838 [Acer negundo]
MSPTPRFLPMNQIKEAEGWKFSSKCTSLSKKLYRERTVKINISDSAIFAVGAVEEYHVMEDQNHCQVSWLGSLKRTTKHNGKPPPLKKNVTILHYKKISSKCTSLSKKLYRERTVKINISDSAIFAVGAVEEYHVMEDQNHCQVSWLGSLKRTTKHNGKPPPLKKKNVTILHYKKISSKCTSLSKKLYRERTVKINISDSAIFAVGAIEEYHVMEDQNHCQVSWLGSLKRTTKYSGKPPPLKKKRHHFALQKNFVEVYFVKQKVVPRANRENQHK